MVRIYLLCLVLLTNAFSSGVSLGVASSGFGGDYYFDKVAHGFYVGGGITSTADWSFLNSKQQNDGYVAFDLHSGYTFVNDHYSIHFGIEPSLMYGYTKFQNYNTALKTFIVGLAPVVVFPLSDRASVQVYMGIMGWQYSYSSEFKSGYDVFTINGKALTFGYNF